MLIIAVARSITLVFLEWKYSYTMSDALGYLWVSNCKLLKPVDQPDSMINSSYLNNVEFVIINIIIIDANNYYEYNINVTVQAILLDEFL